MELASGGGWGEALKMVRHGNGISGLMYFYFEAGFP